MSGPVRLFRLFLKIAESGGASAEELAGAVGVSGRTVYRDIERLRAAGAPIEGASHTGYRLREWPALPALFLSREELGLLVQGARAAKAGGDPALAAVADTLLAKARAVSGGKMRQGAR